MADSVDYANDIAESELAWALRSHREMQKSQVVFKECLSCGENLSELRQAMHAKYCVDCASDRERKQAQYAN